MNLPVKNASITEPLSANTVLNHVGAQHLGSRGCMSALMTERHCRDGLGFRPWLLDVRFLVSDFDTWPFEFDLDLGCGRFGDIIGLGLG